MARERCKNPRRDMMIHTRVSHHIETKEGGIVSRQSNQHLTPKARHTRGMNIEWRDPGSIMIRGDTRKGGLSEKKGREVEKGRKSMVGSIDDQERRRDRDPIRGLKTGGNQEVTRVVQEVEGGGVRVWVHDHTQTLVRDLEATKGDVQDHQRSRVVTGGMTTTTDTQEKTQETVKTGTDHSTMPRKTWEMVVRCDNDSR